MTLYQFSSPVFRVWWFDTHRQHRSITYSDLDDRLRSGRSTYNSIPRTETVSVMSLFRVTCCPLMTSFHSLGEELRISPHKLQLRLSSFEWQVDRSVLALSPRLTRNETICDCLASKQDIENKNTPRRRPDPSNILGREDQQRETFEMNLHFIRFGQSCFLLGILLVHLNHSIIGQIIGQTVRSG